MLIKYAIIPVNKNNSVKIRYIKRTINIDSYGLSNKNNLANSKSLYWYFVFNQPWNVPLCSCDCGWTSARWCRT